MERMRYLITFSCYGTRVHGEGIGLVDKHHNRYGSPYLNPNPNRALAERERMDQPAYLLDHVRRAIVLTSLQETCRFRNWLLLAADLRTNHVHIVVEANLGPEKVMSDLKAYASRALNAASLDLPDRKRWTRHGSTRWLWKDQAVRDAIKYVVEGQGETLAVYCIEAD